MTGALRKSKRKTTTLSVGESREVFISPALSRDRYDHIKIGQISRLSKNTYCWRGKVEHRFAYGKNIGKVKTLQDAITAVFSVYKRRENILTAKYAKKSPTYSGPRQIKEGLLVLDIEQNTLRPYQNVVFEETNKGGDLYDKLSKEHRFARNYHAQAMNSAIMFLSIDLSTRIDDTYIFPHWAVGKDAHTDCPICQLNDPKTIDGEVIKDNKVE